MQGPAGQVPAAAVEQVEGHEEGRRGDGVLGPAMIATPQGVAWPGHRGVAQWQRARPTGVDRRKPPRGGSNPPSPISGRRRHTSSSRTGRSRSGPPGQVAAFAVRHLAAEHELLTASRWRLATSANRFVWSTPWAGAHPADGPASEPSACTCGATPAVYLLSAGRGSVTLMSTFSFHLLVSMLSLMTTKMRLASSRDRRPCATSSATFLSILASVAR